MIDFVCVQIGRKYKQEYVEKLYNGVKRHLQVPHRFCVITDSDHELPGDAVRIQAPDMGLQEANRAWWYKLYMFAPNNGLNERVLYTDLDVVVVNSLDKFTEYNQEQLCICQDFNRQTIPNYPGSNSSVMYFHKSKYTDLWNEFVKNQAGIVAGFRGDQDFLTKRLGDNKVWWPREWAMSWKWEMRGGGASKNKGNNQIVYKDDIMTVKQPDDTSLIVFHGMPDPHEQLEYPVIKDNWI